MTWLTPWGCCLAHLAGRTSLPVLHAIPPAKKRCSSLVTARSLHESQRQIITIASQIVLFRLASMQAPCVHVSAHWLTLWVLTCAALCASFQDLFAPFLIPLLSPEQVGALCVARLSVFVSVVRLLLF